MRFKNCECTYQVAMSTIKKSKNIEIMFITTKVVCLISH